MPQVRDFAKLLESLAISISKLADASLDIIMAIESKDENRILAASNKFRLFDKRFIKERIKFSKSTHKLP